jgi:HK97 gp10 family phage protein
MAKDAIKVDTSDLKRLKVQLSGAAKQTEENVHNAVVKFAFLIDRKAKEKIQKGTRSGRTYKRRSVTHTASASGEPPKTDTGRLVASIRPVLTGRMKAEVGSLSNIAVYGAMLEEGTKNMSARPWLEPTLRENEGALQGLMTAAIKTGGLAT